MSRRWTSLLFGVVLALAVLGCGAPSFTLGPAALPDATVGQAYSADFSGTSSTGADMGQLALSLDSGTLPPGLELTQGTQGGFDGGLAGTPTTAGTYTFTVYAKAGQCTMAGCPNGSRQYTIVVH